MIQNIVEALIQAAAYEASERIWKELRAHGGSISMTQLRLLDVVEAVIWPEEKKTLKSAEWLVNTRVH